MPSRPTQAEGTFDPDTFDQLLREVARVDVPVPTAVALPTGTALAGGRLSVLRRVGEGGMGIVYEAFDGERKTPVALKTLSRLDAGSVYRLKSEFRALSDVRHPNLVRLHELFAERDAWFFTMDLVRGERFDTWVRPPDSSGRARLDETRLRAALPQLISAMQAIHAAGKLHRDLKPSNVLVTAEGRVVVLDFGLAGAPESIAGQAAADEGIRGTPAYMAPEQAAGRFTSEASDYYALGVMLFEALTGVLPFTGSVKEILADKQQRMAPRARDLAVVPADLDEVCASLLSLTPDARPLPAALRDALGCRLALSEPPSARVHDAAPHILGRDAELRFLHEAHQSMRSGAPVVVCVAGESGVGKSALLEAFVLQLQQRGQTVVLRGRCHERENVPYKGLDALVDDLSRYLRRLEHADAAALMPREIHALARLFPVLGRVPAVAEAPKRYAPDVHDLQRRAFDAFGQLLRRMRDRQPLSLVIDDLQWTDQDSVRLLRHLLSSLSPVPMLLLVAHRSEGAADDTRIQSVLEAARDNRALSLREIQLPPLDDASQVTLAMHLLGQSAGVSSLARRIALEARGNPLLVVEIARAAALRPAGSSPPSLEETLEARLASLSIDERRVLSVVALAAQPLSQAVAIETAALVAGHEPVDTLIGQHLVRMTTAEEGARWVDCYHDRVRDLVTRGIDVPTKRAIHIKLAQVLIAQPLVPHELVARCWEQAGDPSRAGDHAAVAAELASEALAFDRAAQLYEKALALGCFTGTRAHELQLGLARSLMRAGRGVVAAEAFLSARKTAPADNVAELTRKAGELYLLSGQLKRGRELLGEGLRPFGIDLPATSFGAIASVTASRTRLAFARTRFVPRDVQDPRVQQQLHALASASIAFSRTEPIRSADFHARWTLLARSSGHATEYASALGWELNLAGLRRLPWHEVEPLSHEAERLCDATSEPMARLWFHYGRGSYHLTRAQPWGGDFLSALADFERCAELIKNHPYATSSYDEPWIHYQRANALTMLGRVTEANRIAQAQIETAWAQNDLAILPAWALTASYVRSAVGDIDQAERGLQRTRAAWQADDLSFQDMMLPAAVMVQAAYRGQARVGWQTCQSMLERLTVRWAARMFFGRVTAPLRAIWAAAAAAETPEGTERRELVREVARASRHAQGWEPALSTNARAALACAQRNDVAAIRELRTLLQTPELTPTWGQAARRRLGILIGGDEGRGLVAQADLFFRNGGVIEPERFTAAVLPGLEIR